MNVHTKGFCPQTQNASYYNALFFSEKCPPSERVKGVCRTAGTNCECVRFLTFPVLDHYIISNYFNMDCHAIQKQLSRRFLHVFLNLESLQILNVPRS